MTRAASRVPGGEPRSSSPRAPHAFGPPTGVGLEARRAEGLRAMARELRAWLADLPQWDPARAKARQDFLEERARAEQRLRVRLHRLPGCDLTVSARGAASALSLAGIVAHSEFGLVGVCAAWAAKAEGAGSFGKDVAT